MNIIINKIADIFPTPTSIPQIEARSGIVTNVLHLVFTVAGALAVFMIMLASFQYLTSQGDSQQVAKAKNTILYAIIGLVIAISGYTIVGFVAGRFG